LEVKKKKGSAIIQVDPVTLQPDRPFQVLHAMTLPFFVIITNCDNISRGISRNSNLASCANAGLANRTIQATNRTSIL
jgi:hypothetical protein